MRIYVGNLPFTVDEDAVRALFEQHGTVERVTLVTDRETGRPRGCGFVDMQSPEAEAAIEQLNGHSIDDREWRVSEARERAQRPRRGPRW